MKTAGVQKNTAGRMHHYKSNPLHTLHRFSYPKKRIVNPWGFFIPHGWLLSQYGLKISTQIGHGGAVTSHLELTAGIFEAGALQHLICGVKALILCFLIQ